MSKVIYAKHSNERAQKYNIITLIEKDDNGKKHVIKKNSQEESKGHILNLKNKYLELKKKYEETGIEMCPCHEIEDGVSFEFLDGKNASFYIDNYLKNKDSEKIFEFLDRLNDFIIKNSKKVIFQSEKEYTDFFGSSKYFENKEIFVMGPANIDLIFDNIIVQDDKWKLIDYEWIVDIAVPSKFILFRSIYYNICNGAYVYENNSEYYDRYGITESDITEFIRMEDMFQKNVKGTTKCVDEYVKEAIDIKDLMYRKVWKQRELNFQIYEDFGDGFSEKNSKIITVPIADSEYSFSYSVPKGVKNLRIDPDDSRIVIEIPKEMILQTNGTMIDEKTVAFDTEDPWIIVKAEGEIVLKGHVGKMNDFATSKMISIKEDIVSANDELAKNRQEIETLNIQLQSERSEKELYRVTLTGMENSLSWRITKGLRKVSKLLKKKVDSVDNNLPMIAVHLHLFYIDLLEEFVDYFSNIPYEFDIFISCVKGADINYVKKKASEITNVRVVNVKKLENQGRDIAPLYVGFGEEIKRYKYFLHVHSKKSKHIEKGGSDWRKYSLNNLVGTTEQVRYIIEKFESCANIGLVYPECHDDIPMIGYTWMGNKYNGRDFLDRIGVTFEDGFFNYPAGSFFWARTEAVKPLFDIGMTLEDFPREAGQIDGTFAHVLERAIAFVSKSRGYSSIIINNEKNTEYTNVSVEPYRKYFNTTLDTVKKKAKEYDIVSFSLFDTLVVSGVLDYDDIIRMVGDKFGFDECFYQYRKQAEILAKNKYGDITTIDNIYEVMSIISPFESEVTEKIKKVEINTVLENVKPRADIKELYNHLVKEGKRVYIVCDSYFRRATIESILVKCGYIGFEDIYISCEEGYSKENEKLWELFFERNNIDKHIHIGSDVYADWFVLEKRCANSIFVMSPFEMYKLSDGYDYFEGLKKYTYEDRIMLAKKIKYDKFNNAFSN